ncbi:hypothetical protein BRADI_1g33155v3 [Brachypodium distachyon]|uniref:Uncharacterized protein n=1 Tax=Brachypodium distachyon TaxID=15368 RepID=A0A2K2DMH0_BRADI|nr:hypothetical protein BRADI_1g33155v3 [Brachypodium distachyon]
MRWTRKWKGTGRRGALATETDRRKAANWTEDGRNWFAVGERAEENGRAAAGRTGELHWGRKGVEKNSRTGSIRINARVGGRGKDRRLPKNRFSQFSQ